MPYTHETDYYSIVFNSIEDFYKCRILYLEEFRDDASGDIPFGFFVERELYRGFTNCTVLSVTRIPAVQAARPAEIVTDITEDMSVYLEADMRIHMEEGGYRTSNGTVFSNREMALVYEERLGYQKEENKPKKPIIKKTIFDIIDMD